MVNRRMVVAGVLAGLVAAVSPGTVGVAALALFVLFAIRRSAPAEDARFLAGLFAAGLLARLVLFSAPNLIMLDRGWRIMAGEDSPYAPTIFGFGDSGLSVVQAWRWVEYTMRRLVTIISTNQMFDHYGWGIHLYLFAGFYALFGFSPLSLTLLNCLLGTLAGLVAYSLARMLGGGKAGRIAGLLVMFFPSLMFWSVTNLKDPLFILLALLLPWAWVRWHRTRAPGWLIIPALVPVAMGLIRLQYFGPALASSAVAWWLLVLKPSGRWKTALIACSLVAILGERGVVEQKFTGLRQYSAVYHRGIVATGGSIYRLYPDEYYKPGWESFRLTMRHSLSAYLNGWRHVLLDPVPWEARAGLSRAAAPQMFLWYPLLAVSVLGLWGLLKRWPGIALTILAQIALFGTVIVLGGGNIGTDLRMRDALTPLMLSLAAIGLAAEWTRGTHEQLRAS